jgi:hypothetical protein
VTRAEVANLDQQLTQQQLDVILVQLKSGTGNPSAPALTPKDEQNSRIAERDKFITLLDTNYQVRQAQIDLMRQTGELENWLQSTVATPAAPSAVAVPQTK